MSLLEVVNKDLGLYDEKLNTERAHVRSITYLKMHFFRNSLYRCIYILKIEI